MSKRHERFAFENIKQKVKDELHLEYRSFAGFLGILIRTVNPLSYKKLCHGNFSDGFRYLFHIIFFAFILFIFFTIPHLVSFYDQLRLETEHLNNFSLAPQLDVNQIIAFDDFNIVVANQKKYDGERLLITQNSISWPDIRCLFIDPTCFFYDNPTVLDFSKARHLVEDREKFAKITFSVVLLLLPGILIVLFAYIFIKFLLIVLILFFIGYLWCMILRMEIRIRQLFLNAVYALSITIIVQTVFGFYYETYYIPHLGSFVLFLLATYLVAEKPFHHFKGHG